MNSIAQIRSRKGGEKITVLTCYDYNIAKLIDGEVDILLIGDSLGMVIHGFESTTSVTMSIMAAHTAAVARGSSKSLIVADLPYGSINNIEDALSNAKQLIASGAHAVKIEGADEALEVIKFLRKNGIEVMGHVGLLPQSVAKYGGYKVQGKTEDDAKRIIKDAQELEAAGCFAIVIEAVPEKLAVEITKGISIPTIGIGASPNCDGQVLVINDLLGLTEKPAKFVKTYANLAEIIKDAAKAYAKDVKAGKFPTDKNTY